MELSKSCWRRS